MFFTRFIKELSNLYVKLKSETSGVWCYQRDCLKLWGCGTLYDLKDIVLLLFIHPHAVPNLFNFPPSIKHQQMCKKEVLI